MSVGLYYYTGGLVSCKTSNSTIDDGGSNNSNTTNKPIINPNDELKKRLILNIERFHLSQDEKIYDTSGIEVSDFNFTEPKLVELKEPIYDIDLRINITCSIDTIEPVTIFNYARFKIVDIGGNYEIVKNEQKFVQMPTISSSIIQSGTPRGTSGGTSSITVSKSLIIAKIVDNKLLLGIKYFSNTNYPKTLSDLTTYNKINSNISLQYSTNIVGNMNITYAFLKS